MKPVKSSMGLVCGNCSVCLTCSGSRRRRSVYLAHHFVSTILFSLCHALFVGDNLSSHLWSRCPWGADCLLVGFYLNFLLFCSAFRVTCTAVTRPCQYCVSPFVCAQHVGNELTLRLRLLCWSELTLGDGRGSKHFIFVFCFVLSVRGFEIEVL